MARLPSLTRLEQQPGRTITAIGVLFATTYVIATTVFPGSSPQVIDGDAIQHYAYLRSVLFDGDVNFINDYKLLYVEDAAGGGWLEARTPTGHAVNLASIGPAILWSPFFLVMWGLLEVLRIAGLPFALDGVSAPFQLSAGVGGIAYATAGAYLTYRGCCRLFPAAPAFWGTLVAWLATPAVYYSLVSPAYSHATSLFAGALFFYGWLATRGNDGVARYALLGALAGLAVLVRWQDLVLLVLPGIDLFRAWLNNQHPLRSVAVRIGVMATTLTVAFLPQLLAWHQIYGQFLLIPQGSTFMHWTDPAFLSVLFSTNHGLFSWTPAVLPAVLGLLLVARRDAWVALGSVAVVLASTYVNASVDDWWAGEAFGARRFSSLTVFFALGMTGVFAASFWKHRPSARHWTAVALTVYNLLFLLQYQLFMRGFRELVPYPATAKQIFVDRLVLPWQLIRHWLGW